MNGSKKILVADDESIVRESLADWLTGHGYQVVTAEDGATALKMITEDDGLGVVVLDVRMPGKDGLEVLEKAQLNHPGLKYIFISGYPSVETMTRGLNRRRE